MQEFVSSIVPFLSFLTICFSVIFVSKWLNISPTFIYLVSGIVVGPFALNLVHPSWAIKFLGDMGVLLLMFVVGLELPLHRLQTLKNYILGLGLTQVVLTTLVLSWIMKTFLPYSLAECLFIASVLSLSSTALIVQILAEKGELTSRMGRVSFSILLFQDLAVVAILVWLTLQKGPSLVLFSTQMLSSFTQSLLFLGITAILARWVCAPLLKALLDFIQEFEGLTALSLIVLLSLGLLMHALGLPMEIGTFLAGFCLAETSYRHAIELSMRVPQRIFLGFFFILVGIELNVEFVLDKLDVIFVGLIALILVKFFIIFALALVFQISRGTAFRLGLTLGGAGEFTFILFATPKALAFINQETVEIVTSIAVLSMLLTPFLDHFGKLMAFKFWDVQTKSNLYSSRSLPEHLELKNHVVLVGYGDTGRFISEFLAHNMIPYIVIDHDLEVVHNAQSQGVSIVFGDIRDKQLTHDLKIHRARILAVTLSRLGGLSEALVRIKSAHPNLAVFGRIKPHEQNLMQKMSRKGVHIASTEPLEDSAKLAVLIMQAIGFDADEIQKIVSKSPRKTTGTSQT